MPLFDFREFLRLSSVLNYNLSAASLNRYNVLQFIVEDKALSGDEAADREQKGVVMQALNYLFAAYSEKRRRLGPMAVLHPLRAAALFTRSRKKIDLLSLLTVLFHDVLEAAFPKLARALKRDGTLFVSGILRSQAESCLAAGRKAGLVFDEIITRGKWVTARGWKRTKTKYKAQGERACGRVATKGERKTGAMKG